MKISIPKNIYAAIFALATKDKFSTAFADNTFVAKSSSLLTKSLLDNEVDLAFIPSLDLLKHSELFVSKNFAFSFDGLLSNSQIYFEDEKTLLEEINLSGDISSNEIILTKLILSERFNTKPEIILDTETFRLGKKNYILSGNNNLGDNLFTKGLSFSDQISEFLGYPFVEFILASKSREKLESFHKEILELDKTIEDNIVKYLSKIGFEQSINNHISQNIKSVYFEMTENERVGLDELLRLPYYHGIINDMVDINFV